MFRWGSERKALSGVRPKRRYGFRDGNVFWKGEKRGKLKPGSGELKPELQGSRRLPGGPVKDRPAAGAGGPEGPHEVAEGADDLHMAAQRRRLRARRPRGTRIKKRAHKSTPENKYKFRRGLNWFRKKLVPGNKTQKIKNIRFRVFSIAYEYASSMLYSLRICPPFDSLEGPSHQGPWGLGDLCLGDGDDEGAGARDTGLRRRDQISRHTLLGVWGERWLL